MDRLGEGAERRSRLAAARADFLHSGSAELPGVPRHVAASWRRSAAEGVVPDRVASEFHPELDRGSRLVRCARPVIEQLAEQVAGIPMCVALTDDRARILCRRDSDPGIGRLLDRVSFAQGFGYAEGAVGTNGVGTVLEFGESVHIVGAEHFVDTLQSFACAGAPVHDPFTGRIAGVIDISCLSEHSTPILHSMVRAAALRIEQNLVLDRNELQQALFDAYSRADARSRRAVLAVGPSVVVANSAMRTLLDPLDHEVVADHVRFLMRRRTAVDDRVDLPSGARVRLRCSAVTIGHDVAGMVGEVALLHEADGTGGPRIPTQRRGPVGAPDRRAPAWRAAAGTVEAALDAGDPVLVLGEPGSGRTALLTGLYPGPVATLDVGEIDAAPRAAAARVLRRCPEPVLHVLRDVDRLSPDAAGVLAAALAAAPLPPLAATSTGAGGLHPGLLAVFRASATVPPLRHRAADLPGLATALLAELAPERDVRLSAEASRLLGRYRWPGNVTQLAEALADALRRRPVGCIEAGDLPAFCQSTPRRSLRPVDEIERDAVVAALRAAGGNRVAAAAALGLARSTLYRKIRQYGITV